MLSQRFYYSALNFKNTTTTKIIKLIKNIKNIKRKVLFNIYYKNKAPVLNLLYIKGLL
jgi:hypothetical protein